MSKSKRTPGEYAPLYWDGDGTPCAHYVNGHVTDEEFRAAIDAFFGDGNLRKPIVPPDAKIRHVYVRTVRAEAGAIYDYEWRQCPKGRGAFPMTVWNITRHRGNEGAEVRE